MYTENTLETIAVVGTSSAYKIGQLVEGFIRYIKFELSLSPQTAEKYQDALGWVIRDIGDIEVTQINQNHITLLKQRMMIRGAGEARVGTIIFALKSFLKYCKEFLDLGVLDKLYLTERKDQGKPLFITQRLSRMKRIDINGLFKRYAIKSGINKKITPHILRHTVATTLLFNGCPINHVKEILGHERLETTCKYYLGVDKRKAKEAHSQFLNFE